MFVEAREGGGCTSLRTLKSGRDENWVKKKAEAKVSPEARKVRRGVGTRGAICHLLSGRGLGWVRYQQCSREVCSIVSMGHREVSWCGCGWGQAR
eukprot:10265805-Karenia_brevis.AAC.1